MLQAKHIYNFGFATIVTLSLFALPTYSMAATELPKVGIVGAVNPSSQGTPPGGASRTIEFGSQVIFREKIVTTATGSLQLAFLDKSTLNIGPNTEMVIDEFVYDPDKGTGTMALSLTKGVMRFVGGQISHTSGVEVKTPVATIGMRGAAGVISYDPQNGANVISSYGKFNISTPQGSTQISRPGFAVNVGTNDAAPSSPTKVTQAQLDNTTGQISSIGKQTGSAPIKPNDVQANNLLGNDSLKTTPSLISSLSGNASDTQTKLLTPFIPAAITPQIIGTANATSGLTRDTGPNSIRTGRAFALSMTSGAGSRFPYVSGAFFGNGAVLISPVLGYRNAQTSTTTAPNSMVMQVGLSINGQGAAQTSSFFVMTGNFAKIGSSSSYALNAGVFATARINGSNSVLHDTSAVSSIPGTVQTSSSFVPTALSVDQNGLNRTTGANYASTAFAGGGNLPDTNYTFNQTAATTTLPSGVGDNRPAQTLTGYVGGVFRSLVFSDSSASSTLSSSSYSSVGTITIQTDPTTSRASADISTSSSYANPSVVNQANFQLGNLDSNQSPRSTYIDQTTFALRDRVVIVDAASDTTVPTSTYSSNAYGSGQYTGGHVALTTWTALASNDPTTAQSFFPGVNICSCSYSQWGFWSAYMSRNTGQGTGYASDRGNLLLWVAGQLADPSLIPNAGSATYSGHAIANIYNNGSQYIAGGNFSHSVNFATRQGSLNISNLDGLNYSGTTSINSGSSSFNGSFRDTAGKSISGSLVGSYYGVSSPPEEIGGQIRFSNPQVNGQSSYFGGGIFQGKR